jgi:uncharacterized protein HemX
MDTETAPHSSDAQPSPAEPRFRAVPLVRAVTLVILLLALVIGIAVGLVTHASLDGANGRLDAARAGLLHSQDYQKAAALRLRALSDAATADAFALGIDTNQLSGLDNQLVLSHTNVVSQGVRISDLDACLSGVEQALNQISLGDAAGAGNSLSQVGPECTGAEPST